MKKILIIFTLFLLLTGCSNVNNSSVESIVNEVKESKLNLNNTYRTGYKYYLPANLHAKEVIGFNEVITHQGYKYYMYVDIVSYYEKIKKEYEINPKSFLSMKLNYKDLDGYLEVNSKKDKYLIEIMYNYAKIELIVDISYLKEAIANAMIILSTIKYNDDIIENMMGEDILNFNDEQLDIFEVHGKESKFLEYVQEFDTYEDDIPDPDLIN